MASWSDVRSFFETNRTAIAVVVGALTGGAIIYKLCLKTSTQEHVYPKDVVILHQVPPSNLTPNSSQFCLKLETFLRIAEIPYKSVYSLDMSSKGKVPWIEHNGESIADSNFCARYLMKKFDVDLDSHLSETDRAISRAFHVMLEENTYWTVTYYRFVDNFSQYSGEVFKDLPGPLRWYVGRLARSAALRNLWSQGMGRHSSDEVYSIGLNDVQSLSKFLADKKYFMGDTVSFVDAVVFAYLANMVWGDVESPHGRYVTSSSEGENLRHYAERMKSEFYPDWDDLVAKS